MKNKVSESNPFAVGLIVALVIVLVFVIVFGVFALFAVALQAGWNQGLVYAVQAAGGSILTISWTTAFNLIIGLWVVGSIFFAPLSGAIRYKAKTKVTK